MNALGHSPPLIRGTSKSDRNVNCLNRNGIIRLSGKEMATIIKHNTTGKTYCLLGTVLVPTNLQNQICF